MANLQHAAFNTIAVAWLSWAVLWAALAVSVKVDARSETPLSRALHIVPLLIATILFLGYDIPILSSPILPRALWLPPSGAILTLTGLAFAIWARLVLASNWSGLVSVKQGHELIRSGPYRLVRHPIYTGLILALTGTALAIDAWRALLALVIVTVSFRRKIRQEERFMTDTFGAAYTAYRAVTPSLIPGLL